ncbi:FG-GAP repeat domain-containing protein [Planotetraspora thailandica]|uniref:FG-GAP repeat domain-containing protein n=1 Tax=Planotetraspora thailandica TaxID=487172 RepID=UPI00195260E5|nr:VCBS repeat-containing protein [Planotetraspora thailandica]
MSAALPLAASAPQAQAASAQEVVIPPPFRAAPRQDSVLAGGVTGFLHKQDGVDAYIWTEYTSGASAPVSGVNDASVVWPVGAGSDLLAIWPGPSGTASSYSLLDPHTGERREMQLPAGYSFAGAFGGKVLALQGIPGGLATAAVLLSTEPGAADPVPVTGVPTGAQFVNYSISRNAVDDRGAAIMFVQRGGPDLYGVLDAATGVVTPLPVAETDSNVNLVLSADRVAWWTPSAHLVRSVPRDDLSAQPQEVAVPSDWAVRMLVGDTLITMHNEPASTLGPQLAAWPLDGGTRTALLDHVSPNAGFDRRAADGSALFVGGSSPDDWAVHRITEGADGRVSEKTVHPVPPVTAKIWGLALSRGTLSTFAQLDGKLSFYQQDVGTTSVPAAEGKFGLPRTMSSSIVRCATDTDCVRAVDGNFYGLSVLDVTDGHTTLGTWRKSSLNMTVPVPGLGGQVRDASDEYVIIDGESPKKQYIVNPRIREVTRSRPVQAAAVWFSTLWSASTSAPGTLIAELDPYSPTPGTPSRTVKTGVACVPTELEATARWLYWSCGDGKPAGVYDLTNNRGFAVPSGQSMLGDGYVVRHDKAAGELKLTDFHTGSPAAERTIATLPGGGLPDDRRITWAVDKYSGHIAYLDDQDRVHVLADGVPDSAPVLGREGGNGTVAPGNKEPYYQSWEDAFYLSRPVDSWQVNIADRITKRQVATLRGGAERGPMYINASWNGFEPNGAVPNSGVYTWELTATYNGGTASAKVGSGTLDVACGRLLTHVYDCDGYPDLLARRSDGKINSYEGQSNRTLRSAGITATWPTSSLLVPIGDLNGDRKADLLVRDSKGALRAYWGDGHVRFTTKNKYALIGTGWERYNVLTSPGDLTGDGRPDLVARDKSGVLWMYAADGKGKFKGRVKIASGQGGYTMMVGVGDINGDGQGDMLGRDKSGYLWRWYGNGKGTFGGRVRLAAGWNSYNAVIGIGDLTQDGKADLLSRDTKGNLYRWTGTGKGTFISRVKLATGWNVYKSLI